MSDTQPQSGALYRRYRPALFSEVVGQPDAVRLLHTAVVKPDRRSHAYILYGPRGCGKTTLARILAKALNCTKIDRTSKSVLETAPGEPCNQCESCYSIDAGMSMDYMEMDAASNNGVDAMRDLMSKIYLSSPGRYRIILLDEAQQLTPSASDAFLKALEEPPAHVIFLLATTSYSSIRDTIKSRCLPVPLKAVSADILTDQLTKVASDAGLEVDAEVIREAVARGRGSVRDSLSNLQALASTGLSGEGNPATVLVDAIVSVDRHAIFVAVAQAVAEGMNPRVLTEATLDYLRDLFLIQMGTPDLVLSPDADGRRADRAKTLGPRRTVQAMDALGAAIQAMRSEYDQRVNLEINLARFTQVATS